MKLNLIEVNWRLLILIRVILPRLPVFCLLVCDHCKYWRYSFFTHCVECRRGLAMRILSVRLSVRLYNLISVQPDRSTTRFPMSLKWSSYVAPELPKRGWKRKMAVFLLKSHFAWRKSATKFLCVKLSAIKL